MEIDGGVWGIPKVLSLRRGPQEKAVVVEEDSQDFRLDRLVMGRRVWEMAKVVGKVVWEIPKV